MVWHEHFPPHKHGCRKGWQKFENFSKKVVFIVPSGKNQISSLWPPTRTSPGKNPPNTIKKCVALQHLATLLNTINAVSKP